MIVSKSGDADCDIYQTTPYNTLQVELRGYCQEKNVNTLLHAISELQRIGYHISEKAVREGFAHVCQLTGLMERWQQLNDSPRLICDTGHNIGGFQYIVPQILAQPAWHHLPHRSRCHTSRSCRSRQRGLHLRGRQQLHRRRFAHRLDKRVKEVHRLG